MVYGYYNQARKLNHKNENPRLCARNSILNQNCASEAKYKLKPVIDEIELRWKEIIEIAYKIVIICFHAHAKKWTPWSEFKTLCQK